MKQTILTIFATLILTFSIFAQPGELLSPTAKAEFAKENFAPCIAEMTKLIALKPKNDAAFVERARCLFLSADDTNDEKVILAEKLKTITDKAKAQTAANAEVMLRRNKAVDDATKAIVINPKNANAFNIRGLVKSSLGRKEQAEAIADFDKAIEIDPKFIKSYFNRGSSKADKSDYNGAIADFTKVLEFEPNNLSALERRSSAFISKYQGGASLEGIDDLVRLSKLLPNEKKYYKYIEYLVLNSAYPYGYADTFKAYIAINPNSPEGYLGLARSQASVERYFDLDIKKVGEYWEVAQDAYLKHLDLNPNVIEPYIELFNLYYDKYRNQESAKSVALITLAKFPNDGRSYILSGKLAESKGDWATAVKEYSRAIELNPKLSLAYQRRSNAYSGLKDLDKAYADLNKAIELNPQNGEAYLARGNYFSSQNKYNEAIADFTQADNLKVTCAKTYRGVVYGQIAIANKEPKNTGNFIKAHQDFVNDDANKCYDTHLHYGLLLYMQNFDDQAAQQFNSALTVYNKHGYNTAEVVEWQNKLKSKPASTTAQGTQSKSGSDAEQLFATYKQTAIEKGATLIGSGIYPNDWALEFNVEPGQSYIIIAITDYDPNTFGFYLRYNSGIPVVQTHDWNDNDYQISTDAQYAMKSETSKIRNLSVRTMNFSLTRNSSVRSFYVVMTAKNKVHWLCYKLK